MTGVSEHWTDEHDAELQRLRVEFDVGEAPWYASWLEREAVNVRLQCKAAVNAIREAQECLSIMGPDGADNSTPAVLARTVLSDYLYSIRKRAGS